MTRDTELIKLRITRLLRNTVSKRVFRLLVNILIKAEEAITL